MQELKLGKLPRRKWEKISFEAHPELADRLAQYAQAYQQAYGQAEPVSELIPFMLEAFLKSDRGFARLHVARPGAK
jgi:hypothetical protein